MTSEDEPVNAGTDVYKEYVWKLIYHKGHKAHDIYLEVQFEDSWQLCRADCSEI